MEFGILEDLKEKGLIQVEIVIEESGTDLDKIELTDEGIVFMKGRIYENPSVAVQFLDELMCLNKNNGEETKTILMNYSNFFKDKFEINMFRILKNRSNELNYMNINPDDISEDLISKFD